jgi:hypothetical protein
MKTIIRNMKEFDRLALVAYSTKATEIFGLTPMDEAGRQETENKLQQLMPEGMTNLWDGLKNGMELLRAGMGAGRLQHIMLFTDGLPNINPPRGILPMVKRLRDKEGGKLPCTINTFGFGYELDSELLSDLAIVGSGAYAFIPDAGFVGTVFVNAMTNILVTMAKDVRLQLTPQNGASFASATAPTGSEKILLNSSLLGGHPILSHDGGSLLLSLGSMQFGQTNDVVVNLNIPHCEPVNCLQAVLTYGTRANEQTCSAQSSGTKLDAAGELYFKKHSCRLKFVDTVRECMKICKMSGSDKASGKAMRLPEAQALLGKLNALLQDAATPGDEFVPALLEDLQGQVSEAFSREDWYNKWGVHYLPSLMCAHLAQICNNFKDPGVQQYGGELFQDLREQADDIFLALPAPTPSARPTPAPMPAAQFAAAPTAYHHAPPPVDMSAYYDRYSG